jgi:PAS domain S-box-containing protein
MSQAFGKVYKGVRVRGRLGNTTQDGGGRGRPKSLALPAGVAENYDRGMRRGGTTQALRESEAKNRALIEAIPDLILRIREDGTYAEMKAPKNFEALLSEAEALGKTAFDILPPDAADASIRAMRRALETRQPEVVEYSLCPNGETRHYEARLVPCGAEDVLGIVRDITSRKELEEQLRQSQKMDAVGRLAGGVAHDFNNMLTAIGGYAELLLMDLSAEDPRRADVAEIKKSADRAADLTRQLLAFSRRQVLQPRVLDLNRIVGDLMKLLRRLIPEDIELETRLESSLGLVRADPAQIEQILMNLAVNARDAIAGGGTITIETKPATVDDPYLPSHPKVEPGRYAVLAVSDTGQGMPRDIQSRIFEPFFTTKPPGSGTGLGLATVYGIVKQSGGYIWVYSEVGVGTTFKIYLPTVEEEVTAPADENPLPEASRPPGKEPESILLVEDDRAVRAFASRVLREQGYRVVEAGDGAEGLRLCRQHGCMVQLAITDVVMPGANGPEMAEELRRMRPELKLLYISGYAENASVRRMLASGAPFLQKPFGATTLLRTVRQVLDR